MARVIQAGAAGSHRDRRRVPFGPTNRKDVRGAEMRASRCCDGAHLRATLSATDATVLAWQDELADAGWGATLPATSIVVPQRGYYDVRGQFTTTHVGDLAAWLEVDGVRVWPEDGALDTFHSSGVVHFDLTAGVLPAGASLAIKFDRAITLTAGRATAQLVDRQTPSDTSSCPDIEEGLSVEMSVVAGDTRALNPWRVEPLDDDWLIFVTQDRAGVDPADYVFRAHLVQRSGSTFSVVDTVDRDAIPSNVSVGIRALIPFNSTDAMLAYWNGDDFYYIHYRRVASTVVVVGDGQIGSSSNGTIEGGYLARIDDNTMIACTGDRDGKVRLWVVNRSGDTVTVGTPVDVVVATEGNDSTSLGWLEAIGDRVMFVLPSSADVLNSPHDSIVRAHFFDRSGDAVTFDVSTVLIGPYDSQEFMCSGSVHGGAFYAATVGRDSGSLAVGKAVAWKLSTAGAVLHEWDFGSPDTGRWYNGMSSHAAEGPMFFWSPDSTTGNGHNATVARLVEGEAPEALCSSQGGNLQARRANVWTPGVFVTAQAGEGSSTTSVPVLRTVVEV